MKLLALILVVSCVIAYAAAGRGGRTDIKTSKLTFSRRFRRETDLENSVAADLENHYPSEVLFDGHRWRREADRPRFRFEAEKRLGRNGFVSGWVDLQQGANGRRIEPTFGASTGLRFRREAHRHLEPHFRFEAEKRLGRNGFVNGWVDLQQGANGRRIEPTFGATTGLRFRRETETVEETEDENGQV